MDHLRVYYFTIAILFTFIVTVNAQNRIAGVIVSEQGDPLPYSTISIKNSPVATISNIEGKFTFSIPDKCKDDTLIVSMLGYESLNVPIGSLKTNKAQNFSLKEKIYELPGITVSTAQVSGEEILKEAFKRQKGNSSQSDYLLDLFVRELFYFNDSCFAVVESAAQLFGGKFPKPGFDIYLDHTRYALGKRPTLPASLANYNPFREFRGIVGKRTRMMKPCNNCQYEIEEYIYVDDQTAAVISLKHRSQRSYPIFKYIIGLDNYAILKFEFETKIPFGEAFVQHHGDITSSLTSLMRTVEYKKFNGRYYLHSYRQQGNFGYQKADSSITYQTPHTFLVLANSVHTENLEKLKVNKVNANLMDYQSTLFSQSSNHDPAFWNNYNIVERTSKEDNLYNSLSKKQ